MISAKSISYQYPGSTLIDFPDLQCAAGEMMLVLGKSGVGKTTLLHMLSGIITAKNGEIVIDGTDMTKLNDRERDHFRGQKIGIVFQKPHFIRSLNVIENLMIAQKLAGKNVDKSKAESLLAQLHIGDKSNQSIHTLSQGEAQRVAIARAVINDPALILADEPTSALDDDNCKAVVELLGAQADKSNSALIIVTHDTRLKSFVDNQIILS